MALVTKSFSDIITFTRTSTATFFNSAGVLTSAGNNVPRFDYNPSTLAAQGLLIEEQRTNRIANAISTGAMTIGTGAAIGPDGQPMRAAIVNSGPVSFPQIGVGGSNSQSFTLSAGQTIDVALSGWFAAGVSGMAIEPMLIAEFRTAPSINPIYALLQINTSNWTVRAKTLPADTTEVSAPSITQFSPGVYRVTWVVRYTQGATIRDVSAVYVQLRDSTGSGTFTGDGIGNFQYFGLQGETGSFPTSYIPTTTTALTRNADQASVNTLSPWYNQITGTVYAEFAPAFQGSATAAGNNPGVWGATQNGLGSFNGYGVRLFAQSNFSDNMNGVSRYAPSGFNTQVNIGPNAFLNLGQTYKTAFAWEASGIAASRDGQAVVTNTNPAAAAMGTHDQFYLGRQNIGGTPTQLNGYLRRITYYPRRLSNAELQAITA